MVWGNPAIFVAVLLGEAFARDGLKLQLGSLMSLDDIPFHYYTDKDGDQVPLPCTERLVTVRMAEKITSQRWMPLLSIQGRPEVRLGSFKSMGGVPLAGPWGAAEIPAERSGDADVMLAAAPRPAAEPESEPESADDPEAEDDDLDAALAGLDDDGAGDDADLDALLADMEDESGGDGDDEEMDPELAALLADL